MNLEIQDVILNNVKRYNNCAVNLFLVVVFDNLNICEPSCGGHMIYVTWKEGVHQRQP